MTRGQPVLHALSIEPPLARPGETVRITFRTHNVGSKTSPPGAVHFGLPAGLDPLNGNVVVLEPVDPGEEVTASLEALVASPEEERAVLAISARVVLPDDEIATNDCRLTVRTYPVLDGPASGTHVEALDSQTVRVRAVVVNEGDGPACDLTVVVPAPPGCVRADGEGPASLEVPRLEAGASTSVTFDACLIAPDSAIRADGAEVRRASGERVALPARDTVELAAVLAPPRVELTSARRRLELAIEVRNEGWVAARDVCISVALPAGLRVAADGVAVDGVSARTRAARAFARIERAAGEHVITIACIPRRDSVRIALVATHAADVAGGRIAVRLGLYDVAVPFAPERARDVRVRVLSAPAAVVAGEAMRMIAHVLNAGDVEETLHVELSGGPLLPAPGVPVSLTPGTYAEVELTADVDRDAPRGTPFAFVVAAFDSSGERARTGVSAVALEPAPYAPPSGDSSELQRGRSAARVRTTLAAADDPIARAPLEVAIDVEVEDDVETLTVRASCDADAAYVPGSTSIDGCILLDRDGASPLQAGLVLRGVSAGMRVRVAWKIVAPARDELMLRANLDVDGAALDVEPLTIRVRPRAAFALPPSGLAYHVDAATAFPSPSPPAVPQPAPEPRYAEPVAIRARYDDDRSGELARALRSPARTLADHLLAVRAFFPGATPMPGEASTPAIETARSAVRDVYDRLSVKLRIPGFDIAACDFEDAALRGALAAALEDVPDAEHHRAALEGVPLGAPVALRALLATIPIADGDEPIARAVAHYAAALDESLARHEAASFDAFDEALARSAGDALDRARRGVLDVLREAARSEIAC